MYLYRRRETIFERERKARAHESSYTIYAFPFFFSFSSSPAISHLAQTGVRFFFFFFLSRESNETTCYWPGISTPSQQLANRRSFFLLANRIKSVWCGARREREKSRAVAKKKRNKTRVECNWKRRNINQNCVVDSCFFARWMTYLTSGFLAERFPKTQSILSLSLSSLSAVILFHPDFISVSKKHNNNNNPKSRDALGRFLPFCLSTISSAIRTTMFLDTCAHVYSSSLC